MTLCKYNTYVYMYIKQRKNCKEIRIKKFRPRDKHLRKVDLDNLPGQHILYATFPWTGCFNSCCSQHYSNQDDLNETHDLD